MDWYILGMAKERKSPQEKKSLEYTRDHFTFAEHSSFPKTWKRGFLAGTLCRATFVLGE